MTGSRGTGKSSSQWNNYGWYPILFWYLCTRVYVRLNVWVITEKYMTRRDELDDFCHHHHRHISLPYSLPVNVLLFLCFYLVRVIRFYLFAFDCKVKRLYSFSFVLFLFFSILLDRIECSFGLYKIIYISYRSFLSMEWHDLFRCFLRKIFLLLLLCMCVIFLPLIWNSFVRQRFTCASVLGYILDQFIRHYTKLKQCNECQVTRMGNLCKYDGRMFTLRYINSDVISIANGVFASNCYIWFSCHLFIQRSSLVVNQYIQALMHCTHYLELNKFV